MEIKEINKILEYKRPCDSWLCPDCDTENNIHIAKCVVCGSEKGPSAIVLKQWSEADDVLRKPSRKTTDIPSGPIFKETEEDYYVPEKDNTGLIVLGIVLVIIILFLFVALIGQI